MNTTVYPTDVVGIGQMLGDVHYVAVNSFCSINFESAWLLPLNIVIYHKKVHFKIIRITTFIARINVDPADNNIKI